MALFNLIRRSADITVDSVRYQSYSEFARNVPVPTNLNLIAMKPLRGTALVVFPPSLVFMVVDNLFGGDGRFLTKNEGREFTNTEQRIIRRSAGAGAGGLHRRLARGLSAGNRLPALGDAGQVRQHHQLAQRDRG